MPSSTEPAPAAPQVLLQRPVQLRGSALARRLLAAMGWTLQFDGLPTPQGVVVFYPHTSNWDFFWFLLARWAMGWPVGFLGKASLFRWPLFGPWLRRIGGVPVDRSAARGVVAQLAAALAEAQAQGRPLWLGLAPEGTRAWRPGWRSGFHQLALQAGMPLALSYVDYARRQVGIAAFVQLSGQVDADMALIHQHLAHRRGRRPELASPVKLIP